MHHSDLWSLQRMPTTKWCGALLLTLAGRTSTCMLRRSALVALKPGRAGFHHHNDTNYCQQHEQNSCSVHHLRHHDGQPLLEDDKAAHQELQAGAFRTQPLCIFFLAEREHRRSLPNVWNEAATLGATWLAGYPYEVNQITSVEDQIFEIVLRRQTNIIGVLQKFIWV